MTAPEAQIAVEFSRIVPVDRIGHAWQSYKITATPTERAALAGRLGLVALNRLDGEIRVRRVRSGQYIALEGSFEAALVQSCVVSLEPLPATLQEKFAMMFGPIGGEERHHALELDLDPFADEPDPLDGNEIDIGEAATQYLALALDPYPRSKQAEIPEAYAVSNDDGDPDGPFAVLERHKARE